MNDNNNVITLARLEELGACSPQRAKFAELFGESVVVTRELMVEHAEVFEWHWAADELLTNEASNTFLSAAYKAAEEHDDAIEPFAKTYNVARGAAWAAYDDAMRGLDESMPSEARRAADEARRTATQEAYAVHQEAIKPAELEYKRALAAAFADAFLSPENQPDVDTDNVDDDE